MSWHLRIIWRSITQEEQKLSCYRASTAGSMNLSNGFVDTILSLLQWLWHKKYNCPILGQVARPVSISYIPSYSDLLGMKLWQSNSQKENFWQIVWIMFTEIMWLFYISTCNFPSLVLPTPNSLANCIL